MGIHSIFAQVLEQIHKSLRDRLSFLSRWPGSVLLGLITGVFISAFVIVNYAVMDVLPGTPSHGPLAPSINQVIMQFLFRSVPSHQEDFLRAGSSSQYDYLSYLDVEPSGDALERDIMSQGGVDNMDLLTSDADFDLLQKRQKPKMDAHKHLNMQGSTEAEPPSMTPSLSLDQSNERLNNDQFSGELTDARKSYMGTASSLHSIQDSPCDVFIGKWIEDDTYPLYNPGSCPFVDACFDCHQNGRPDTRYTRWKWAPRDCSLPRFNGTDMLDRLRGKRLAFVGDSVNRNQWELMLCLLREALEDKSRLVRVRGGQNSKLPGSYVYKFLDYDCTVEMYTSPFLISKEMVSDGSSFIFKLDKMDSLERSYRKANILVFNTGHWWTPNKVGEGDCFQVGSGVCGKLDVMVAYRKALATWARWVDRYVVPQNSTVFFGSYSPVHYFGGQWNAGGKCNNETEPIYDESFLAAYPAKMQDVEDLLPGMKIPVHLLNITRLSDYRKDAHPAIYGHPQHLSYAYQDCSHWCLPGLPDTWNELLYYSLIKHAGR